MITYITSSGYQLAISRNFFLQLFEVSKLKYKYVKTNDK